MKREIPRDHAVDGRKAIRVSRRKERERYCKRHLISSSCMGSQTTIFHTRILVAGSCS